ncbi:MAG: diguanylate cyclase [Deltaproteobacteria bacterium]|nr:diguanylate cyclase [Deltaproteobacteria bacterium]
MGLRLKLGLTVAVFVTTVLLTVSFLRVRSERLIYEAEMQNRGQTLLEGFAIPCAVAMANNEITTLDNYVHAFGEAANRMDLRYLTALDVEGKVVANTDQGSFAKGNGLLASKGEYGRVLGDPFTRAAIQADLPTHQFALLDGERLLEMTVPVKSGLRWGTLKAGFSMAAVEREIAVGRNRAIIADVAITVGMMLIAYFILSLLVVNPVMAMEEMARRFGGGDLRARVDLKQKDEIGLLATQLNAMAQQIQDYTGSLERLVQARTAELAETNIKLVAANEQLDKLAKTDGLTGLFNRRHFMETLDFEIRRGSRSRRQFTLVLVDVDHFKHYNDTNGHTAGDELLQRLSSLLQLNLRSIDVVARYGGEEFVVLLLDTGPEEGYRTAVKLQQVVAAQPCPSRRPSRRGS